MSETIRLLNRWPHTERGFCFRCGEWYSRVQLRLPAPTHQPFPIAHLGTVFVDENGENIGVRYTRERAVR